MTDDSRPHCYPPDAPDEVIAWRCSACGEWVNEYEPDRTACAIDWRNR